MFSLDELLESGKKIYIKNNTDPIGKFVIVFTSRSGKAYEFLVPVTDFPMCLSDSIPKEDLHYSPELRNFLRKGVITLMDPEEAEKILSTPKAREEMEQLNLSAFSASNRFASQKVSILKQINIEEARRLEKQLSVQDTSTGIGVISPWVRDSVMRVESNDLTVKDAQRTFRIKEKELTDDDLAYIISNTDGQLKHQAQQALASRQKTAAAVPAKEEADEEMTPEEKEAERRAMAKQHLDKGK